MPSRGISVISLAGMTSQMKNNSKPTSGFGTKCEKCGTINTITLEKGELKNRYRSNIRRRVNMKHEMKETVESPAEIDYGSIILSGPILKT